MYRQEKMRFNYFVPKILISLKLFDKIQNLMSFITILNFHSKYMSSFYREDYCPKCGFFTAVLQSKNKCDDCIENDIEREERRKQHLEQKLKQSEINKNPSEIVTNHEIHK